MAISRLTTRGAGEAAERQDTPQGVGVLALEERARPRAFERPHPQQCIRRHRHPVRPGPEEASRRAGAGVPVDVIAKDYVLSYFLAGTSSVPALAGLRFKGGTALKKMIFAPSYRFSEDLDFSVVPAKMAHRG